MNFQKIDNFFKKLINFQNNKFFFKSINYKNLRI